MISSIIKCNINDFYLLPVGRFEDNVTEDDDRNGHQYKEEKDTNYYSNGNVSGGR